MGSDRLRLGGEHSRISLIDMALLRYAKKSVYRLCSATVVCGCCHCLDFRGAHGGGDGVAHEIEYRCGFTPVMLPLALGLTGFVIVIIAGWTTANPNLYRAGLAAQAVFPSIARQKVTLAVGATVVMEVVFPFIYRSILPILVYAGLVLVPIGGIVFAEQHIFPDSATRVNWHRLKGVKDNMPALITWAICLVFGFGLNFINIMPFVYLFLPTWALSIIFYTILAKKAGADKSYPEAEKREQEFHRK